MTYSIKKTDGNWLVELPDFVLDNTTTSITLIGKDAVNFGEEFSQNFIDVMQRFSNPSAPIKPLQGQLWYDQEQSKLKVFNGTNWKIVSPAFDGYSGTINLDINSYPQTILSVVITDQNISTVTSQNEINAVYLPSNVVIDDRTYEFASRFPDGLSAGVNLARSSNSYVLAGQATSGNVLSVARTIRITGAVTGEILFDGSSNVNISTQFSNVYVGNTNVTIAGVYSNITVSSNGVIQTASNIAVNDIVSALGYLPYGDSNVSTMPIGNTVVSRDENGSFSANLMTGTSMYTQSFSSNTVVSVNGAIVGQSLGFNGTSNLVVFSNLAAGGDNLTAGVYNRVTVNDYGLVTQGELVENMPIGAMVLYSGVVIPEGWTRCNGTTVTSPDGATITTPNLSNVLVGSSFYIMKAWSNLDLPSNDTIVGTISINLSGGGTPSVFLVGGPNTPYPPLVWSNVNVGASGSTLPTDLELRINSASLRKSGRNYKIGDKLYVDLPNFDKKKSKNACIRVDSIHTSNTGIKTYTLIFEGSYYSVPSSGINGIWINLTNFSQPVSMPNNQGYLPTGKPPKKIVWDGIPGFRKNKPRRVDEDNDNDDMAQFDLEGKTDANRFLVPDVDFGNDLFFDAVALVLTNGDPNSVMLSQTNIYGDLSNLTIAQVMKNLETRINSGLPPRLGKYMLSYDDIVNHAGYLKCPVNITKFTIAVQNQLMVLTTSDNANRFAYSGIFPSDEKLFGAAYVGFERYRAIFLGRKDVTVAESLESSGLSRTYLPQIDDILVSEFLTYVSKLITNAKIAVANNRVARLTAEIVNKYSSKKIPIPDPILPKPLLTTGNISVIVSEASIDGLPAVVGGTRGAPTSGGGSFVKAGSDKNSEIYGEINSVRYGISQSGGNGGGNNPAGINAKGSFGYDSGTGTDIGVSASFSVSGNGFRASVSYQTGDGFLGSYASAESAGKVQWNANGAANYRSYYGVSPPDPSTLTINQAIAVQEKMIVANDPTRNPKAIANASSAVGLIQQTKANLVEAKETAGLTGNENLAASQGVLKAAALQNAAAQYGAQMGKPASDVTQKEAGMALSYGAGAASDMAKWSAANPNGTLGQFKAAYPKYSADSLLNNPPCTPQGLNTKVASIPQFCSDFHNLPAPNASALLSESQTVVATATNLAPAVSPAQPMDAAVAATVAVTQTQVQTVAKAAGSVPLTANQSAEINRSLNSQGVQSNLGNGGNSSTVGLSSSQKSAIAAGPGAYGSSQRASYNAATGRGGSPVVGGSDPAAGRSSGGSLNTNSRGGVTGGQGVQATNSSSANRGTNSTGTGRGNQVGSSSGAGPYSNGGGSGSSFNSGSTSGGGCFAYGTLFKMADGSLKAIQDIRVGDVMFAGGRVEIILQGDGYTQDWYSYNGVLVTGSHPVLDTDGIWRRVEDTALAIPVEAKDTFYSLYNNRQRMVTENNTVFTDFLEVGFQHPLRKKIYGMEAEELIDMLNGET